MESLYGASAFIDTIFIIIELKNKKPPRFHAGAFVIHPLDFN